MMPSRRQPASAGQQGFTLVEVMIALLIFGLLAAAGVALLSFSVRAQAATAAKLDDIGALNRFNAILAADLAQARNRPTRDRDGTLVPAFEGGSGGTLIAFVRGGWTNLDEEARSDAQKVAYAFDQNAIVRIAYPMLDGSEALPAAPLLEGVTGVRIRYRTGGAWTDRWEGRPDAPLPDAIEFAIDRRDGRHYRALFLVGTGYAPQPIVTGGGFG